MFLQIQNVSSQDCIRFDTKHLRPRSQYHVKVRSIPCGVLRGSWSEWSETVSFLSPAGETRLPGLKEPQWSYDSLWVLPADPPVVKMEHILTVCLMVVVVVGVTSSAFIFWKKQ